MGNFTGHMDEAIVFYMLCLWWMYRGFTGYIRASLGQGKYRMQLSYVGWCCGRKLYLEQALKIFFPFVAITGELIASHLRFRDEFNQAAGVKYLMHLSIFGLFLLHGVMDLLTRLRLSWVPPKADFLSGCVAFLWYAMGLYYHIHPHKPEIENALHLLLMKPVLLTSLSLLLAILWPHSFLLDFVRCFRVSLIATWTTHLAFLLYKPGFLGMEPNPNLNFFSEQNIHYVPAAFGFHVIFNLAFMYFFYAMCHCWVTRKNRHRQAPHVKYSLCQNEDEECQETKIKGHDDNGDDDDPYDLLTKN